MSKEIYLKAAALVASGKERFSCNAVRSATGSCHHPESPQGYLVQYYAETMSPEDGREIEVYDIEEEEDYFGAHRVECRNFRVLLLCMMAACCEDIKE